MELIVSSKVYENDQLLMRLARTHGQILAAIARAASDVTRTSSWTPFGYRNCEDFARERLQRNARWLRRLSALHRALQESAALRLAISGEDGGPPLRRAAAFEICTVLTADNATQWIARARQMTVRALRDTVRAARHNVAAADAAGDAPRGAADADGAGAEPLRGHIDVDRPAQALVSLRIAAPPEAHVAHDEVMDLHQAVVGRCSGTTNFIENVVAESSSSGCIPLPTNLSRLVTKSTPRSSRSQLSDVQARRRRTSLERNSQQATQGEQTTSARRARKTLARLEEILARQRAVSLPEFSESDGGRHSAGARVRTLTALIRIEDEIEIRMADILVELAGHRPWKLLGYTGRTQYAIERLGWSASETYRRVRLASELPNLPALRTAYENGRVGVEAAAWVVRNVARVGSSSERQRAWVEHAATTTIKRLRHEDRMLQRGCLLKRAGVARQVTENHVRRGRRRSQEAGSHTADSNTGSAETVASQRAAAHTGRRCPADLPSDTQWKAFTARAPGQARGLVLELGSQLVERVAVRGALAELPLSLALPQDVAESLWGCLEAARQRLLLRIVGVSPADESRLAPSERIAGLLTARGLGIPHWVAYLNLLEEFVWTWDDPRGMRRGPNDAIHSRDGWICNTPGCTQRHGLQSHHLKHRAHGGCDAAWNLHSTCGFHHLQGEHGGLAHCHGRAPLDVVWRLGIPELAMWFRNERRIPPPAQ